jgi:Zn-dependent protease
MSGHGEKAGGGAGGLFALMGKLAIKAWPLAGKLLKAAKGAKVVLGALSFASYACMFTWKFSAIILVSLFVHEYGHIWQMRRCGMRTKGIYFIPFVGGAAVADEAFPSAYAEASIALMGPLWGFGLAVLTLVTGVAVASPLLAAAGCWIAMVNLFNLAPVNPLDGGRVVKSVSLSLRTWLGKAFAAASILVAGIVGSMGGLHIFLFVAVIGALELGLMYWCTDEKCREHRARWESAAFKMSGGQMALAVTCYLLLAVLLVAAIAVGKLTPGADAALLTLRGL